MIAELKPYPATRDSGVPWLGPVPEHWDTPRLKTLFREVDRRSGTGLEPLLSLRMGKGLVDHHALGGKLIPPESLVHYKRTEPGELVMNRMRAAAGLFGATPMVGLVSPDYAVFRPRKPVVLAFFSYLFRTPQMMSIFRLESRGLGTGESGFLRLYSDRFGILNAPCPPPDEQAAIVRFLDHANRRIQRYIRAKQKLIKLLEEQKQAIIHQAVTRGLDPNVRMKPSGAEWLGDVPEHWEVSRLRRLLQSRRRLTYGVLKPGEYDPGGRLMVRAQDFSFGWSSPDKMFRVTDAVEKPYARCRLAPGDLVFTVVGAGTGNVGIVPRWLDQATVSRANARVAVNPSMAIPEFVALTLESPVGKEQVNYYSKGSAQPVLNLEHVAAFIVPVPPMAEQRVIVGRAREETRTQDAVAERANQEISLLREYGTRLIADVVTGKLDVRKVAARLPNKFENGPLEQCDSLAEGEEEESDDIDAASEEADE